MVPGLFLQHETAINEKIPVTGEFLNRNATTELHKIAGVSVLLH